MSVGAAAARLLPWVRRCFSFRYRARWLALIAIGLPILAVLLTVVVPWALRGLR